MLDHWEQYLTKDDFVYLTNFVTDTINGIKRKNEYVIFLGDASTGKNNIDE